MASNSGSDNCDGGAVGMVDVITTDVMVAYGSDSNGYDGEIGWY